MFHGTPRMMRTAAVRPAVTALHPDDDAAGAADDEISEIAHDFRNLLAGMQMFAEAGLAQIPAESPVRRTIEQIRSACGEAGEMCGTLVSAARHAKTRQHRERLDLSALVDGAAPLLAASVARATTLKFETSAAPAVIRASRMEVRQILTNLVLNASQALGDRPGTVVVSTGMVDTHPGGPGLAGGPGEEQSVFLEVSDTGCGMDEATQARLFEPFFTTKLAGQGQGLGMASVLRIVTAHGGAIRVHSDPGGGTTIRVLFPCAEPPETRLPATGEGPSGNGCVDAPAAGTVLLVDDDRSVRMLARVLLESHGWSVLTADGGEEAVERLREHADAVSIAVFDMSMPGMDGAETLRRLRELDPDLPAVVFSGSSRRELEERFGTETPDAYLCKPLAVHDLLAVIHTAARKRP